MKFWQAVLAVIITVACIIAIAYFVLRPGPYAVKDAAGRNYVYSVEPRQNGTGVMWTKDSELGAYCTTDQSLIDLMKKWKEDLKTRDIKIYFTYESINNGSAAQQIIPGSGCPNEEGGVTMYHLTGLMEVPNAVGISP